MSPFRLWVYLSAEPLFWLSLTLLAWLVADGLARRTGRHPLANPVLIAVVLLGALLGASRTPYATYFAGAQFVHFLLGPATVALAVPLYRNRHLVRRDALPIAAALVAGSAVAILSAVGVAALFGVPHVVLVSLAPKIGHHGRRDGGGAVARRHPGAHRDARDPHRDHRRDRGDAADERALHTRLRRARLRRWPRRARDRHGARLHGGQRGRNLRRHRHGG